MFMFVYSVVTIAVVGLFFQIVNALGMYFAQQQVGLGAQMSRWHTMAYEFACDSTLLATVGLTTASAFSTSTTGITAAIQSVDSNLDSSGNGIYSGLVHSATVNGWESIAFTGTYAGSASQRMVMTFVKPTNSYGGVPGLEVGRQLRRISKSRAFTSAVYNSGGVGAVDITVYADDAGGQQTLTVSGFSLATVPVGSNVIVSLANCT